MAPKSKVSMDTIAQELNVSKVTVSKALNDKEGVSEELRLQIKQKASELGYQMNLMAKGLKNNETFNIGILIAERYLQISNSYYFGIYVKFTKEIEKIGYTAIMEILDVEKENNNIMPKMVMQGKIDALIILGECKKNYLKQFVDFSMPVLFFDFYDPEIDVDSVITDNYHAGCELTKLLIDNNHKDIGFIGNIYSTTSIKDRYLGYYKALLDAKIELNPEYVVSDRDDKGNLIEINLPDKMPSAFVCNNDQVAYEVCKKLNAKGYKIPEDISIVAFDNSIYSGINTQLTSFDANSVQMVEVATKAIIKKLKVIDKKYDRILIKGQIIERNSIKHLEE